MTKLIHICGNTYYLDFPIKIGVYTIENECMLIDTGVDKAAGKMIAKELEAAGLTPQWIINTHAHADHFGGNAFLQERYNCEIYASSFEGAIIENPLLEPFFLYSAVPLKELENKFLFAKPSKLTEKLSPGSFSIAGQQVQIVPLPGHTPEQIGIITPDDVFFVGDAYFPVETLEKYGVPYFADITQTKETLQWLSEQQHAYYFCPHDGLRTGLQEPISKNLARIGEIEEFILENIVEKKTREELLSLLFTHYDAKISVTQYYLLNSVLGAFLSHLVRSGQAAAEFSGNYLYFGRA